MKVDYSRCVLKQLGTEQWQPKFLNQTYITLKIHTSANSHQRLNQQHWTQGVKTLFNLMSHFKFCPLYPLHFHFKNEPIRGLPCWNEFEINFPIQAWLCHGQRCWELNSNVIGLRKLFLESAGKCHKKRFIWVKLNRWNRDIWALYEWGSQFPAFLYLTRIPSVILIIHFAQKSEYVLEVWKSVWEHSH